MKKLFALTIASLAVACGSIYTKTPVVNPDTGETNFTYLVSPGTSNILATAQKAVDAIPSEVPYAPLAKDAALGVLAVASGVLSFIARIKSSKAKQQTQAADILAGHVVNAGLQQKALTDAANTPAFTALAEHIDNNTITK